MKMMQLALVGQSKTDILNIISWPGAAVSQVHGMRSFLAIDHKNNWQKNRNSKDGMLAAYNRVLEIADAIPNREIEDITDVAYMANFVADLVPNIFAGESFEGPENRVDFGLNLTPYVMFYMLDHFQLATNISVQQDMAMCFWGTPDSTCRISSLE